MSDIRNTMAIADINIDNVKFFKLDKTEEERAEEKQKYNSFMNFMTDIIIKYGMNESND